MEQKLEVLPHLQHEEHIFTQNFVPAWARHVKATPFTGLNLTYEIPYTELQGLSYFVSPGIDGAEVDDRLVGIAHHHGRTVMLSWNSGIEIDGVDYSYLTQKGGGYVTSGIDTDSDAFVPCITQIRLGIEGGDPAGLLLYNMAKQDISITNLAARNGIRIVPIVGVSKLDEVILLNRRTGINKLRGESNLLDDDDTPVLLYRAFVTPFRIEDLKPQDGTVLTDRNTFVSANRTFMQFAFDIREDSSIPLEVRKSLIPKEITQDVIDYCAEKGTYAYTINTYLNSILDHPGDPIEIDVLPYFDWYLSTITEQFEKLHSLGIMHGFATQHNMTLDARLLDFDGAKYIEQDFYFNAEWASIESTAIALATYLKFIFNANVIDIDEIMVKYFG